MTRADQSALPLPDKAESWEDGCTTQDGPGGARTPLLRGLDDQHLEEVIAVGTSVHPTSPAVSSNPLLYAERMSRIDGCGECVQNYEAPCAVYGNGPGRFLANYVCEFCGHAWQTAWSDR